MLNSTVADGLAVSFNRDFRAIRSKMHLDALSVNKIALFNIDWHGHADYVSNDDITAMSFLKGDKYIRHVMSLTLTGRK